jgi:hypothetical protein
LWLVWIPLILLAIVLFFLLFIFVLTLIPIKYSAKVNKNEKMNFCFQIKYFFRLIRFVYAFKDGESKSALYIFGIRIRTKDAPKPQKVAKTAKAAAAKTVEIKKTVVKAKAKKVKKEKTSYIRNFFAVLTDSQGKTIIKLVLATIRKILRMFKPKYLDVSGVVGFSDPCNTGLFVGAYEALAAGCGFRDKVRLEGKFDTDETFIQIKGEVRGSVSIFRLVLPVIGLILKKPVRELLRDIRTKNANPQDGQ